MLYGLKEMLSNPVRSLGNNRGTRRSSALRLSGVIGALTLHTSFWAVSDTSRHASLSVLSFRQVMNMTLAQASRNSCSASAGISMPRVIRSSAAEIGRASCRESVWVAGVEGGAEERSELTRRGH